MFMSNKGSAKGRGAPHTVVPFSIFGQKHVMSSIIKGVPLIISYNILELV